MTIDTILEALKINKSVSISTTIGQVDINSTTFDCTYIGKFGSIINSLVTKHDSHLDPSKKIAIISAICKAHSKYGGVTLIGLN